MVEVYSYKDFFTDIYQALPGSKLLFVWFWFLRLLSGFTKFVSLFIVGLVVDFFTTFKAGDSFLPLVTLVAVMVCSEIFAVLLRILSKSKIQETGLKMQQQFRMKAIRTLLHLDLFWHEQTNSGTKMNKISKGSATLDGFMNLLSNDLSNIISGTISVVLIFLFISWKYLLFILVFAIIFFAIERYFAKRIYETSKALFIREDKMAGKAHEISNNIVSVKSLGLHAKLQQNLSSQEKLYKKRWLDRKRTGFNKLKLINSIVAVGHGLFLLLVGYDVLMGSLSVGMMVVYVSYYSRFASEIGRYSNIELQLINYKTRFKRLKDILIEPETDVDGVAGKKFPKQWDVITFNNVDFTYGSRLVLRNFSLEVKRHQKIGIVGLSGSGKSTLMKLFLRLYKPVNGSIFVGDKDLFSLSRSSLRSNVTVVLQDQELFNLSLRDNVMLAGKSPNSSLFRKSIEMSALSEVLKRLPKKEKTLIGEKGYRLSGGERQRLGIARAIYRNSDILILDEATSNLDSKTEEFVQRSLESLNNKTVLVIAHRLATLKNVDKIIFMDKGRIVESGTFKELIDKKGKFFDLWKRQELSK